MALSDFEKAFAKARKEKGAGATFTYKDKEYTTNYANETKGKDSPSRPKARPKSTTSSRRSTSAPNRMSNEQLVDMASKAITKGSTSSRRSASKSTGKPDRSAGARRANAPSVDAGANRKSTQSSSVSLPKSRSGEEMKTSKDQLRASPEPKKTEKKKKTKLPEPMGDRIKRWFKGNGKNQGSKSRKDNKKS